MYESVAKLPCGEVTVAKLPCGEVTGNLDSSRFEVPSCIGRVRYMLIGCDIF